MAASSRKLAEAYKHLETRMGSGDAPPKTADEYSVNLEGVEGFNWDEFKADPDTQSFIKGAHAKGITNAQLEFVLGEYMNRAPALVEGAIQLDQQAASEALKAEWKTDAEFKQNIQSSYRAAQAFGGDGDGLGSFAKLEAKFGSDPDFIAFTARIGREMAEDTPAGGFPLVAGADFDVKAGELRQQLQDLPTHDPKRAQVQKQLDAMYEQRYSPKKFGAR